MSSISVSTLPDLCLLTMFRHVPLKDVIQTVGCVCKNWARVQRDELRLCRRTLVIQFRTCGCQTKMIQHAENWELRFDLIEHLRRADGSPWISKPIRSLDLIGHDTLRMPRKYHRRLSETFCTPLMDLLSNITHLIIIQEEGFTGITVLVQITRMISHFTNSLVCLTVSYRNISEISASEQESNQNLQIIAFFESINRLQRLSRFKLDFDHPNSLSNVPKLSILSRLSIFSFVADEKCLQFFIDSLRQYATGDDLRIDCCYNLKLSDIIGFNDQLASKFTRVDVKDKLNMSHYNEMRLFSGRFSLLMSLKLTIDSMPLTMMARCLSALKQLVHLKLHIGFIPEEEQMQTQLVQISSVLSLTLYICTQSHLDTERLHIAQLFPNLQALHLSHTICNCRSCDYLERHYGNRTRQDYDKLMTEYGPRIAECMRLARQPFRQCANLHTIQYETSQIYMRSLVPRGLITVDQL